MRLILVSDTSPARAGVYGLRFASFADALAKRGHEVVLLCPAPNDAAGIAPSGTTIGEIVKRHDFAKPLILQLQLTRGLVQRRIQQSAPRILRRAANAGLFILRGGTDPDWVRCIQSAASFVFASFRPDVVWGTFGSTSNLVAAQHLARSARCPWIMDIKDNWALYTPAAVRPFLRRRFSDAAGYTANSELHADIAGRYLDQDRRLLLYSGIGPGMGAAGNANQDMKVFLITLIGSTYGVQSTKSFLSALGIWLSRLPSKDQQSVKFRYCGVAYQMVFKLLDQIPLPCDCEVTGNISHEELGILCRRAAANCYIWAAFTFHHKMLELLATGSPVVAYPGEHNESLRLAAEHGTGLIVCRSQNELMAAFDRLWGRWRMGGMTRANVDMTPLSWAAGAAKLESFFLQSIESTRRGDA